MCVCRVSVSVCVFMYVYPHVHEKLSVGEMWPLYETGKRKKREGRIRERIEKQGEVGTYRGVKPDLLNLLELSKSERK